MRRVVFGLVAALAACGSGARDGVYDGTGTVSATFRPPDFVLEDRLIAVERVTFDGARSVLRLGETCELRAAGTADSLALTEGTSECALVAAGKRTTLRNLVVTATFAGAQLTLQGTCVSAREDGVTGSCSVQWSGARAAR